MTEKDEPSFIDPKIEEMGADQNDEWYEALKNGMPPSETKQVPSSQEDIVPIQDEPDEEVQFDDSRLNNDYLAEVGIRPSKRQSTPVLAPRRVILPKK